jgi:hypothetical protein
MGLGAGYQAAHHIGPNHISSGVNIHHGHNNFGQHHFGAQHHWGGHHHHYGYIYRPWYNFIWPWLFFSSRPKQIYSQPVVVTQPSITVVNTNPIIGEAKAANVIVTNDNTVIKNKLDTIKNEMNKIFVSRKEIKKHQDQLHQYFYEIGIMVKQNNNPEIKQLASNILNFAQENLKSKALSGITTAANIASFFLLPVVSLLWIVPTVSRSTAVANLQAHLHEIKKEIGV